MITHNIYFFLNRPYSHPCKYGSTTFILPSIKSRKNDFGSYLGNTSNPVSFHVTWKVSIIFPNNADLELMTTLIVLSWWIASAFKKICQLYCGNQLYVGGMLLLRIDVNHWQIHCIIKVHRTHLGTTRL